MASWENNIYYLSFLETSKQKVNQVGVIIKPIRCNCMYSKKELQALERGIGWWSGACLKSQHLDIVMAGGSSLAV